MKNRITPENTEVLTIYDRYTVETNPHKLYVFGENQVQQKSKVIGGGQAIIRGLENTFGFCTLTSIGEFWFDDMYQTNIEQIDKNVEDLLFKSVYYKKIVFPFNGLGTGRAKMQKRCPKTFLYMSNRLLEEFEYNNIENLYSQKF